MKAFLGLLLSFAVVLLLLLGMGSVVGFLLHRLLPAVELGVAILIGVLSTGFSVHFLARLMAHVYRPMGEDSAEGEELEIVVVPPFPAPRKRRRPKR